MSLCLTFDVKSSSATSSVIVAMAASGIITLKEGIPVIMGSNVGTSVTSTMISLTNLSNLEEYRLGFSAATIHDLFNWCTILLLLPLEMGTGMLEKISGAAPSILKLHCKEQRSSFVISKSFVVRGSLVISKSFVVRDSLVISKSFVVRDSLVISKSFVVRDSLIITQSFL